MSNQASNGQSIDFAATAQGFHVRCQELSAQAQTLKLGALSLASDVLEFGKTVEQQVPQSEARDQFIAVLAQLGAEVTKLAAQPSGEAP